MSCSFVGLFLNLTNTAAVCPFNTGTRIHWHVITGDSAGTICFFSSSTYPQRRSGSFSDFSSSPPMNGMMFPTISGQSLNVFPAPEIAWYVVATTSYGSNSFHAVRTGAYDWIEQFGFTATKPLFVPRRSFWYLITSMCCGLISGTTIGTSGVHLWALLFETTGVSVFA